MVRIKVDPKGHRYIMVRSGPGILHSLPNGHPCLKDGTSWRTVSGIRVNTRWGCIWIQVRNNEKRNKNG